MKRILLASLAMTLTLTSGIVDAQSTNGERPGVPREFRIDTAPPSAPVEVTAEASYISATTRVLIRFELPNPDDVSFCTLLRTLGPSKTGDFEPQPDPADPARFRVVEWYPPPGDAWFQIFCEDASGNRSVRSAPAFVHILAF